MEFAAINCYQHASRGGLQRSCLDQPKLLVGKSLFAERKYTESVEFFCFFLNCINDLVVVKLKEKLYTTHCQMLGKVESVLPAKIRRLVGFTEMIS